MQTYFTKSTIWLNLALIIYFAYQLFSKVQQPLNSNSLELITILDVFKPLIAIAILILLMQFFQLVNKNGFFNHDVSNRWMWISTLLLGYALICFFEIQLFEYRSYEFAVSMFLSSLSYGFSKAFKEGNAMKKENDLTI